MAHKFEVTAKLAPKDFPHHPNREVLARYIDADTGRPWYQVSDGFRSYMVTAEMLEHDYVLVVPPGPIAVGALEPMSVLPAQLQRGDVLRAHLPGCSFDCLLGDRQGAFRTAPDGSQQATVWLQAINPHTGEAHATLVPVLAPVPIYR